MATRRICPALGDGTRFVRRRPLFIPKAQVQALLEQDAAAPPEPLLTAPTSTGEPTPGPVQALQAAPGGRDKGDNGLSTADEPRTIGTEPLLLVQVQRAAWPGADALPVRQDGQTEPGAVPSQDLVLAPAPAGGTVPRLPAPVGDGGPEPGPRSRLGRPRGPSPYRIDPETGKPIRNGQFGYTRPEMRRLLRAAKARIGRTRFGERDYLILVVGYRYALRPCEVAKIVWGDIDLLRGRIRITTAKNGVPHWEPLEPDLAGLLADYRDRRPFPRGTPSRRPYEQDAAFPNRKRVPRPDGSYRVRGVRGPDVNDIVQKIARKAKIDRTGGLSCGYSLRRSLGYHYAEGPNSLQVIGGKLRQRTLRSTPVYSGVTEAYVNTLLRRPSRHLARF